MPSYQPATGRRTQRRAGAYPKRVWTRLLKGLLISVAITLACILVFALFMQWIKPSDTVVRVINQLIKLGAILAGVWAFVGRGGEKGLLRGALLGLVYMALGVGLYALLSGQNLPVRAYLSDVLMGVAAGGVAGAIVGNLRK
ncbi:MAG: TIGR04086 family membrane protein [Eubacteriales bacterium]|nr:TIGR04086 family membrane protein [Eubacteriales bacterium]